jgi:hypothetical protein
VERGAEWRRRGKAATQLDISVPSYDLVVIRIQTALGRSAPDRPPLNAMNRRVVRQILIALAIFAGIVLAFAVLAQYA